MTQGSRCIKILNSEFYIESGDRYIDTTGDVFEPHMTYLFESLITRDMIVADIGANVGMTTLCFSQLAKHVYAFEPSNATYEYLERNISIANAKNVTLCNKGLSSRIESGSLTYSASDRTGASLSLEASRTAGHITETVHLIAGDEYFDNVDINFIKIDVEGHEQSVLSGLSKTLQRCKPIVVLEMNHFCLNVLHRTPLPDFVDFLLGKFPILLGIHSNAFIDLRDDRLRYRAMYDHVNRGMYYNLVGMYTIDQSLSLLKRFAQIKP